MDYLVKNTFTEAAGSRKGFPKVAMIITDGKSQDPVEEYAKRLRNIGVEIFVLGLYLYISYLEFSSKRFKFKILIKFVMSYSGIKEADEDELKEIASTPHSKHIYNVQNFDMIDQVQKKLISEVCSGVENQLNALVSGEEGTTQHRH